MSSLPTRTCSRLAQLAPLFGCAVIVAACGGGGGGGDAPSPPPSAGPPAPVAVSGVVADGPLQGATACYDLNDNRACDAGEPRSGATDADGRYSFDVPAAEAGKHAVIVQVPADAIDKDTGAPVGAALTLIAPPTNSAGAQQVFVSPLTTLVAQVAEQQNLSPAEAVAQVKSQLGLNGSPLANFVQAGDTQAARLAATVNAVVVNITTLATAAGVPPAQLQALVASQSTGNLPALAAQVAAAPAASTPAQVAQSVSAAVLADANISAGTVATVAAATAQAAAPLAVFTPGPFVSLRRFNYTDANNYSVQLFTGDSSVTDAKGEFVAHEWRKTVSEGADVPFNRNRAYWTGNAWQVCNLRWEVSRTTNQTATTPQKGTFCDGSRSEARIVNEDISGQRMADVVARIRAYPLPDAEGLPVNWGPDPALLGDAVFPQGSELNTRSQVNEIGNTESYGLLDKVVFRYGDGSFRHLPDFDTDTGGQMAGNIVDPAAVVGDNNAVFLDEYPVPPPADTTLRAAARYLVAFGPDANNVTPVRFYKCNVVAASGSSRDCVAAGDGTIGVGSEIKGGKRLARFATGYPVELLTKTNRQRFFIESDGTVFRGTTDLQRTIHNQRLNGTAWAALRGRLGIPAHTDATPPAGAGPFDVLRSFTFTDAANFTARRLVGDSSVLDAQGYFAVDDLRRSVSAGVQQPFVRNRLYWTGSEWFDCGDSGTGIIVANSNVPFDSLFCKAYRDERASSTIVTLDGRRMSDVVRDIRRFGSKDGTFDYRGWGPDPLVHTQLANAFFPAGSTMEYRGNRAIATPIAIATGASDQVRVPPADPSVPFDTWPFAASLEEFIAKNPGNINGGPLNGSTAFFVFGYQLPAPPAPEYTNAVQIRVSFDPVGNKARFYRNYRSATTGNTANYVTLLDTTYSINTYGGVRVLSFAAMPDGFEADFRFQRMFAERAGGVWYAFKDSVSATPTYSIRLNREAGQALFTALGI